MMCHYDIVQTAVDETLGGGHCQSHTESESVHTGCTGVSCESTRTVDAADGE
jgi:hypothetical protein